MATMRHSIAPTLQRSISDPRFLTFALHPRGLGVFAGLVFAMPFADLLFDLFDDKIDGGVKITFTVFGEEVGTRHRQANGTGELLFRRFAVVVFEGDARVNGPAVQVIKLYEARDEMVFNGFGEGQVVRRKDQFHDGMMVTGTDKIQPKSRARAAHF